MTSRCARLTQIHGSSAIRLAPGGNWQASDGPCNVEAAEPRTRRVLPVGPP